MAMLCLSFVLASAASSVLSPLLKAPYTAPTARAGSGALGLYVNCATGNDSSDGRSPGAAFATIERALSTKESTKIQISGGLCTLQSPLQLNNSHDGTASSPFTLSGDGHTAISGGQAIGGWAVSPQHGGGNVLVADVTAFPLDEIKVLRVGTSVLRRSRWPKLVGDGLTTPNFLFAASWSVAHAAPADARSRQQLGVNPMALPTGYNLSSAAGTAYVHVLGCVEKDVNSQLTRVLSVGGSASQPTATINFRNAFTVSQRYYFENVDWGLEEGEFFHDSANQRLYCYPTAAQRAWLLGGEHAISPILDRLIEIRHARHVAISNLSFLDTTYYADGYWDGPAQQPSDAALRISYSTDITVEASNFLGLSGYGVAIGNATTNSSVVGCLFDSMGQGGVILYGYDSSPVGPHGGAAAGNNTQPTHITVAHNVMSDLGQTLVHVAGVALRAASDCHVHHNRISHTPRYGIQSDSFYSGAASSAEVGLNSRRNLFEFNILHDTCRTTTDTGAFELLGSGDPGLDGGGWDTETLIRWNNISETVGSSSSDGKNVCVHGAPAKGCRDLVWGIYLDGGQSGVTSFGNIIGATLHGAIFDNAGGNNSHVNNIFLGEPASTVLMDFGAPGASISHPVSRSVSGSVVQRNIFYWTNPATAAMGAQVSPFGPELKPNGSDLNLFFSPAFDAAASASFPGQINLSAWQGNGRADLGPVTCANTRGAAAELILTNDCRWGWDYNATDLKFRSKRGRDVHGAPLALNLGAPLRLDPRRSPPSVVARRSHSLHAPPGS